VSSATLTQSHYVRVARDPPGIGDKRELSFRLPTETRCSDADVRGHRGQFHMSGVSWASSAFQRQRFHRNICAAAPKYSLATLL
jgi:hypothetical protein